VSQQDIEIILTRHWASHLTTPIFLVNPDGDLLYYNEAAESILGRRFSETGRMGASVWSIAFKMTDDDGFPLKQEEIPLNIALKECRPVHRTLWLVGLDKVRRHIKTTCLPLIGQADHFLGAVALFWEMDEE
jgi:PAS domain-containing protein